jgi:hypothetical protein
MRSPSSSFARRMRAATAGVAPNSPSDAISRSASCQLRWPSLSSARSSGPEISVPPRGRAAGTRPPRRRLAGPPGRPRPAGRQDRAAGRQDRAALAPGPVVEFALVEEREQRVEDRAVGLEHFVDEGDGRLRQEAGRHALVAVLLQGGNRQRAEQLLGDREAGQQALEIASPVKRQVQPPRQFAFGGTGWPNQQRVLAGQRRQKRQPDNAAAFDQPRLKMIEQRRQALAQTALGKRLPWRCIHG